MKQQEIGVTTLEYDDAGNLITSYFEPTMKVVVDETLLKAIKEVKNSEDSESIKQHAEVALASWFSKMNEIELADRDEWTISSEVKHCEKWPNNKVKKCVIQFEFKRLEVR